MLFFTIFNADSGEAFRCAEGTTILQAMELSGYSFIPIGCKGGGCGICKIRVLSGEYRCGKMSAAHIHQEAAADGFLLACKGIPTSDLSISTQKDGPALAWAFTTNLTKK